MLIAKSRIPDCIQPKPHVLVRPYREITRVLINPGSGLTDARVPDKLESGSCGSMLEDGEIGPIALDE